MSIKEKNIKILINSGFALGLYFIFYNAHLNVEKQLLENKKRASATPVMSADKRKMCALVEKASPDELERINTIVSVFGNETRISQSPRRKDAGKYEIDVSAFCNDDLYIRQVLDNKNKKDVDIDVGKPSSLEKGVPVNIPVLSNYSK